MFGPKLNNDLTSRDYTNQNNKDGNQLGYKVIS